MAVNTSANYNKIIALPGGKKFHSGARVDFAGGRSIELDDRNIMQGYPSIEDKTSEENSLEVGGAYASLLILKLNNFENAFTGYDFRGAVIRPWIGLTTAVHWRDGEIIEKAQKGVFNVSEAPEAGNVITIAAYDNLIKMDARYAEKSKLQYPATLAQIVTDVCSVCGVNLATAAFPNSDYTVAKRPASDTITCREILRFAAQLAGCFARCNTDGAAEIRWYETPGHVFDIGKNAQTVSVALADTKVTGVQVKGNDDAGTIYKAGTDNYAIRITDNPLAQNGLQSLVNALGTQLIGMQYASYSVDAPMNPAIETGDIVDLTDKKGVKHTTIVSGLQIDFGEMERYLGDAESETENQTERFSKADKAQDTADQAQTGVNEAKTEISQLNGKIVLKADKDKLISLINISPESIKIKSNRLEITGFVTFSDLENSGRTTINGDNIKTGRIESEDGDWWLDLESGTFYLKNGTFAGNIEWTGGEIYNHGGTTVIGASNIDIKPDGAGTVTVKNLDVVSSLSVDGDTGVTHTFGVKLSNGDEQMIHFENGILTDYY